MGDDDPAASGGRQGSAVGVLCQQGQASRLLHAGKLSLNSLYLGQTAKRLKVRSIHYRKHSLIF
jgi:hypothetical protein